MRMEEFLAKEAATGQLKPGLKLPNNDTHLWGNSLWNYLTQAADSHPDWSGKVNVATQRVESRNSEVSSSEAGNLAF